MRILVVSQYFWPEQFRINDLVLSLQERGHAVTVLTGVPNYPGGELFDGYDWWSRRRDEYEGIPVYRVPLFVRRQGRGWQLALNYLSFVVFGSLLGPWFLRKRPFDVIFVFEPSPFTVGIPAALIRRLKKAPVIFWVQDLWPESLESAGAVSSPAVLNTLGRLVRWIYHRCDHVLVQSRGFIEPAIAAGADKAGRKSEQIKIALTAFVASTPEEQSCARAQIAFYASTRSYRPVFALHGLEDIAEQLSGLAAGGNWGEMFALIDDEILDIFCVLAPVDELAAAVKARYQGLADHISIYTPFIPGEKDAYWQALMAELKA